jgi:hypothetical protein
MTMQQQMSAFPAAAAPAPTPPQLGLPLPEALLRGCCHCSLPPCCALGCVCRLGVRPYRWPGWVCGWVIAAHTSSLASSVHSLRTARGQHVGATPSNHATPWHANLQHVGGGVCRATAVCPPPGNTLSYHRSGWSTTWDRPAPAPPARLPPAPRASVGDPSPPPPRLNAVDTGDASGVADRPAAPPPRPDPGPDGSERPAPDPAPAPARPDEPPPLPPPLPPPPPPPPPPSAASGAKPGPYPGDDCRMRISNSSSGSVLSSAKLACAFTSSKLSRINSRHSSCTGHTHKHTRAAQAGHGSQRSGLKQPLMQRAFRKRDLLLQVHTRTTNKNQREGHTKTDTHAPRAQHTATAQ